MERVTLAADAGVEDNADTSSVREVGDQTFFGGFLFKRWSDVCSHCLQGMQRGCPLRVRATMSKCFGSLSLIVCVVVCGLCLRATKKLPRVSLPMHILILSVVSCCFRSQTAVSGADRLLFFVIDRTTWGGMQNFPAPAPFTCPSQSIMGRQQ